VLLKICFKAAALNFKVSGGKPWDCDFEKKAEHKNTVKKKPWIQFEIMYIKVIIKNMIIA